MGRVVVLLPHLADGIIILEQEHLISALLFWSGVVDAGALGGLLDPFSALCVVFALGVVRGRVGVVVEVIWQPR